jgi:hypothetical protein
MSITVVGPKSQWASVAALRHALAEAPETGEIEWGRGAAPNKYLALSLLKEEDIRTPLHTEDIWQALAWDAEGHDVWGRLYTHSHGTDISFRPDSYFKGALPRWVSSNFWVVKIPNILYEVRGHVWGGKCFRMGIKQSQGPTNTIKSRVIRSSFRGWELNYSQDIFTSLTTDEVRRKLRRTAVQSCKALGVMGGAVDMVVAQSPTSPDGFSDSVDVYMLEVNTAPALGPNTLAAWVKRIREVASKQNETTSN